MSDLFYPTSLLPPSPPPAHRPVRLFRLFSSAFGAALALTASLGSVRSDTPLATGPFEGAEVPYGTGVPTPVSFSCPPWPPSPVHLLPKPGETPWLAALATLTGFPGHGRVWRFRRWLSLWAAALLAMGASAAAPHLLRRPPAARANAFTALLCLLGALVAAAAVGDGGQHAALALTFIGTPTLAPPPRAITIHTRKGAYTIRTRSGC